jgi:conjugal transfer pilus assembly protein TrbC
MRAYHFLLCLTLLAPTSYSLSDVTLPKTSTARAFEAGQALAKQLQKKKTDFGVEFSSEPSPKEPCSTCLTKGATVVDPETTLYICLSFSVPDSVWISLSKQAEKLGGTLLLRGIPDNSFPELSRRLTRLKHLGLNATVQIDPEFFQRHQVSKVPTFVVQGDMGVDKLSGNISLEDALRLMAEGGEVSHSRELYRAIKGGSHA